MPKRSVALAAVAGAIAAAAAFWSSQQEVVYSQSNSVTAPDDSVVSLKIEFGARDVAPRAWDGSVAVSGGQILSLTNWHPRPGDVVEGNTWKLPTRRGPNYVWRPWERQPLTDPMAYLTTPGLLIDVRVTSGTTLSFKTANGTFSVKPSEVKADAPAEPFGGVMVERVTRAHPLSAAGYQNDFASIVALPGGEVWATWVGYRDQQNDIFARRFDGRTWGEALKVNAKPGDIYLSKAGRDRGGNLWIVWSEQIGGNFDLYARRFDGKTWSGIEKLTDDPQPDVYHQIATDSNGNMWVVWQGFRSGKADIFARRYDGRSWAAAERISASPANDWEPSIAADNAGRVWVSWDTYDRGNYDVMVRQFDGTRWADPVALAATPKFEAHSTIACDNQNRVWVAWNESGAQWGKDTGFVLRQQGTRLYESRWIGLAVHADGEWREPAADFNSSMPPELRAYNDSPALVHDGKGRVWLFFRHRTTRLKDVPSETPMHRAAWEIFGSTYDGHRWTTPSQLPVSQGRMDMRAGYTADRNGNLYAAWPTDRRDFEEFLFQKADVFAGRIPSLPGAPAEPRLKPRVIPKLNDVALHADEPGDLARLRRYAIQSEGKTYRIYRGDTHRHTEISMDGNNDGSVQETYRYALDAAELDFMLVSEHNGAGGPDVDYVNHLMQQQCDVWMLPSRFAPLYGYERSVAYPNGHRNILFARRGVPTLPIPPEEQKGKTGAAMLYEYLKKNRGIAISHTSATNMGTDWRDNDPEVEPLVEIYQGDRVSAEYEGAPKAAYTSNAASAPGGFRPPGYVWNAWAKGYKLGVQTASDHLSTHISYACTLATDFTREGLMDAMRKRHSYGATDNIILDYRLQSGGREYIQGDIVKASGEFKFIVKAIGTQPIRQVDVIKNNTFVHNVQPLAKETNFTYIDNQPRAGESYYYVRVIQVDDNIAWSSPIWVTR